MSSYGPLDLSDANLEGFKPLDPGQYNGEIFEVSMDAVKNEGGNLPVGTPGMKVQVKLLSDKDGNTEGIENRRVFTNFWIPPKTYDAKKAGTMKGMIARFFMALGYTEEQVRDKKFSPDFEDLKGRPCVVTIKKEQKKNRDGSIVEGEFNNPISAFKAAGSLTAAGSGLL